MAKNLALQQNSIIIVHVFWRLPSIAVTIAFQYSTAGVAQACNSYLMDTLEKENMSCASMFSVQQLNGPAIRNMLLRSTCPKAIWMVMSSEPSQSMASSIPAFNAITHGLIVGAGHPSAVHLQC
jgi:hypothetical protein